LFFGLTASVAARPLTALIVKPLRPAVDEVSSLTGNEIENAAEQEAASMASVTWIFMCVSFRWFWWVEVNGIQDGSSKQASL
jgi:hypothetical protein